MGTRTEYSVEILIDTNLSSISAEEAKAALRSSTAFDTIDSVAHASSKHITICCFGDVRGDYSAWGRHQTREIFRALGPCQVSWAWYYQDREPDDSDYFEEDDYHEMISPLEQLAQTAETTEN